MLQMAHLSLELFHILFHIYILPSLPTSQDFCEERMTEGVEAEGARRGEDV